MGDDTRAAAIGKIGICPLEQHGGAVAEADEKNQVDEQPRQPRRVAGKLELANLRDGGGTADGRHRAFVPILECGTAAPHPVPLPIRWGEGGRRPGEGNFSFNDFGDVFSHLHRGRRNARHRFAVVLQHQCHVADGENFRMTGHAQIGIYLHASAAIQFAAELFGERRGGDASGPDDVAGVDDFSVGEFHHTFADAFDLRVGFDIHAEMDELPLGFFRKAGRQMRQDARSAFEQNDVRLRGINAAEIQIHHRARQFGEGAGEFHAGRPAANHDNGHEPVVFDGVGFIFSFFKREQDTAAEAQRVVESLEAGRELLPFVVAEVAGVAAQREHEIVVFQRARFEEHFLLREVETDRLVEQHGDVGTVGQDGADGLRDIRGGQRAGGHLIEQRLEQMMVGPVNDRDARIGMPKMLAERQAAEARAEHDDVKLFGSFFHMNKVEQPSRKATREYQAPRRPRNVR